MTSGAVVDASVALKWVVVEPHAAEALALYRDTVTAHAPLLAPPHLLSEVSNALYRRMLRGDRLALSETEATTALTDFLALPLQILAPDSLYARAFTFAKTHRLPSLYDSLYVTLAQMLAVDLWTADQRLLAATRTAAPWVRWIGDYHTT